MVKRENAIKVDIVKSIVIQNYIKFGEHVKKMNELATGPLRRYGMV